MSTHPDLDQKVRRLIKKLVIGKEKLLFIRNKVVLFIQNKVFWVSFLCLASSGYLELSFYLLLADLHVLKVVAFNVGFK